MKLAIFFLALIGCAFAKFSEKGEQEILKAHNKFRAAIAKGTFLAAGKRMPLPSHMLKMKWDPELAESAQNWTDTCPKNHSESGYAENMFFSGGNPPPSLDPFGVTASVSWTDEFKIKGFPYSRFKDAAEDMNILHAVIMSSPHLNAVGCGVKYCEINRDSDFNYPITVTCQYKSVPPSADESDELEMGTTQGSLANLSFDQFLGIILFLTVVHLL